MSSRDRRDDDLEERLDELEDVLSELRRDLRETERDRRGPPRPPRLSELVRFTEQYTIPTLIALLETTIKSLELLQGTLRLADPGRSVTEGAEATGDRLADVRDGATAGLSRSLAELRTALSEADLPEDAASRSIIADARDLTAEIESRIEEGRREADAARSRRDERDGDGRGRREDGRRGDDERERRGRGDDRARDGAVHIDVTDPDADGDDRPGEVEAEAEDVDDAGRPEVDVESELESIKRQLDDDTTGTDPAGDGDGPGDEDGSAADDDPGSTADDETNGADDADDH
ncbi:MULTISPECIES: DUF7547 family protein [Haloferacaceae]|uniref:Uncharacterized protein n=1 Tax=Halorubrum glutamatedens TaxID=2707018 RepID=A0ABD5QP85_9EURY|nr:hypothetical protein [Halobellus captivus]